MPFIDFAALKAAIPIEEAARALKLKLTPDGNAFRAVCPVAENHNPRGLLITPGKGFICFSCGENGGIINLAMHVRDYKTPGQAAQFLAEQFSTSDDTVQDSTVRKNHATPEKPETKAGFDPEKFWASCVFSEEVSALGITQEDAARVLIGWHPRYKALFLGSRNEDGSKAGFTKVLDPKALKLPPQWVRSSVVPFQKRA